MKISTKGRYGLMLLVDLAEQQSDQPISLKSIAERNNLSEHYLEQLIAPLRNGGFVRSIRGAYGGYVLARHPREIVIEDVLLALEGPITIVDEEIDDGLQVLWDRLREAIHDVLSSMTLQDLVELRQGSSQGYMYYI
ncbi:MULTISPECIES: cysteine metabolism transcriptional regulator CymR [Alicyclobacillus]|uniref:Transcriptional regulator, BadM/Rrf2 family n=1 Tax=Alicyclobacillus acidocaldarius subsp. acidocaldarius (strain ATCC 27009 / DSM 446 / BCRC 14685 / JCM 5260 / KCTC 1825 / NBRC 15652 / NCIMB 11725 / NRRL B-14509 / 104-IA) TaxID=521098 RepID=C8WQ97_ALIAD|nr:MULTISPECIES: Rrf2 family transcriptional regulator [Alicyclobacillus]ACV59042.1 transcriptional regulator, BadM/Rrf2 family [Alicyclobacillus acidocaldarius subsp. acidocaldarius DSM 446]